MGDLSVDTNLTGGSDTRIWSEDGRLLASGSGQLLCRPNPFWQER
jgi:hypothetical protein